jgi:uncharacterized protein
MSSPDFDPLRLDVSAFAKAAGELEGRWPLAALSRLAGTAVTASLPADGGEVRWRATGEARVLRAGESQVWLHLAAATSLPLTCQRCLNPVEVPLSVDRSFLFVHGEDAAAQLDADSEDDVLALTRALDLRELIEDELLLSMPLVPRHDVCPEPLPVGDAGDGDPLEERPNPFAALAALKRAGPPN